MDFGQFWRDLRHNIPFALAAFLLCGAVGWAIAFLPPNRYTASTQIVAEPAPGADAPSAVAIIQYVLPLLPAEATDAATLSAARAHLSNGSYADGASVTASLSAGSDVVTVAVKAPSSPATAALANAVARQLSAEQPAQALYKLEQLSPAFPPGAPSNVRKPTLIGALGLGVIAAVFAALGAAALRRRLNKANEIKKFIGTDVIAEIPRMRDVRPAIVAAGTGLEAEVFQQLRSNLMFKSPEGRPFTVAVTSCRPSEGKTFVAANLAWVLASGFAGSIAVDCDVRRPALHTLIGVPFSSGVSGPVRDALHRIWSASGRPSLGVIPAGISDRHPADVIADHLPQIMDEITKSGRTVVVDCPPVLGTAETAIVASLVDLVIVVIDGRKFNPELLQACLSKLEIAGAKLAGVVLNRVRPGRDQELGYGYYLPRPSGVTARSASAPSASDRGGVGTPTVQRRGSGTPGAAEASAVVTDSGATTTTTRRGHSAMPVGETANGNGSQELSGEAPPDLTATR